MPETTFLRFPEFAAEIRCLIWREALPEHTGPSLFFFREGYWRIDYSGPTLMTGDVNLIFHHELLDDDVQFDVPLFHVSHESRNVALAWSREHGIKIKPSENGQHICARSFNPQHDALYFVPGKWNELRQGSLDDTEGQPFVARSEIKHLAMSLEVFRQPIAMDMLPEVMWWFNKATDLLIIIGQEPIQQEGLGQWELATLQEGVFTWDPYNYEFEFREPGNINAEHTASYNDVWDILNNDDLMKQFISMDIQSLEVRLALAIRR
ncbi:hypothetical protein F4814DRAFT_446008 [Daldinia grandis]|nr:hypothetical protein F4814DRAFT_446008 [Daldinia grandis]